MEDEKLIECVRKYEFLFNLQHPKYMDTIKKDMAWKAISEQLKQPAAACKQKWQGLRDAYRRALNKKKGKNGQEAKNIKKWKYEDEMSFVAPFFFEKKTFLESVELTSDDEEPNNDPNNEALEIRNCNSGNGVNDTAAIDVANSNIENVAQNNTPQHNETKRLKAIKKVKVQPVLSASAVLMTQLLNDRNKHPQREHDELDRFFLNISGTVKKFSPYLQALAKNKIFSLVSEMELQQLAPLSITPSNQYACANAYTSSPPSTSSDVPSAPSATPMPTSPDNWNEISSNHWNDQSQNIFE